MGVPVVLCVCCGQAIEDEFPFASSIVMDKIKRKRTQELLKCPFRSRTSG
jgi:hypothetical protein